MSQRVHVLQCKTIIIVSNKKLGTVVLQIRNRVISGGGGTNKQIRRYLTLQKKIIFFYCNARLYCKHIQNTKKVFYCSCVQSILKYAMKYPLKFIIYCRSEFYTKCTTDFSQFQRLPQKVQLLGSLRSAAHKSVHSKLILSSVFVQWNYDQ